MIEVVLTVARIDDGGFGVPVPRSCNESVEDGALLPTALFAVTRNWYCTPYAKLFTRMLRTLALVTATLAHVAPASVDIHVV
jgi:hypothetical protein